MLGCRVLSALLTKSHMQGTRARFVPGHVSALPGGLATIMREHHLAVLTMRRSEAADRSTARQPTLRVIAFKLIERHPGAVLLRHKKGYRHDIALN